MGSRQERGADPPDRPTSRDLTQAQRRRVEAAAALVADLVVDGWAETVAERASAYISEPTWTQLMSRGTRRCRTLADIANAILTAKTSLHDLVGWFAGGIAGALGWGHVERRLARELAKKIPLPADAKLVATARGVQVTGVLICVVNGDDLLYCQCFIDLALAEAKTQVKALLASALEDWQALADFRPQRGPLARATA